MGIWHIFLVALLILFVAILPLELEPSDEHIGDRLALHATGMLTLVAFKYGVLANLPSVPYRTFTTIYFDLQLMTIVSVVLISLTTYHLVLRTPLHKEFIDHSEDSLLVILILVWGGYFSFCAFFKRFRPWEEVLKGQMANKEIVDPENGDHTGWAGLNSALDALQSTTGDPVADTCGKRSNRTVYESLLGRVDSPSGRL